MVAQQPEAGAFSPELIERFDRMKDVAVFVRSVRAERNIPMKNAVALEVKTGGSGYDNYLDPVLLKLLNLKSISEIELQTPGSVSQVIRSVEYYVPLEGALDTAAELEKLEKELEYTLGFLDTVSKKLANERFVNHAPAQVVDTEKAKLADAEAKIRALREQIDGIKR